MRRVTPIAAAVILCAGAAYWFDAADSPDAAFKRRLSKRISLNLDKVPLVDAAKRISAESGTRIELDAALAKSEKSKRSITLCVRNLEVEYAISWLARFGEVGYVDRANAVILTDKPDWTPREITEDERAIVARIKKQFQTKISFEFVDTRLDLVLRFMTATTGVNILLDPALTENDLPMINLRVTEMEAELALKWILKLADWNSRLGTAWFSLRNRRTYQVPSDRVRS